MANTDYPSLPGGVRVAKLKLDRDYAARFGIVAGWSVTAVPADFIQLDPRARELGVSPDFRVYIAKHGDRLRLSVEIPVTETAQKTLGLIDRKLVFELEAPLDPLDGRHDADSLQRYSDYLHVLAHKPRLLAAFAARYLGAPLIEFLDSRLPQA